MNNVYHIVFINKYIVGNMLAKLTQSPVFMRPWRSVRESYPQSYPQFVWITGA